MKIENLEDALSIFEKCAMAQEGINFENGSAGEFNKYSKNISLCATWLYKNDLLIRLTVFYKHKSKNVRGWAARFLLEIDTRNAVQVLEELTLLNDVDSKYVLLDWKEGNLNMDSIKE